MKKQILLILSVFLFGLKAFPVEKEVLKFDNDVVFSTTSKLGDNGYLFQLIPYVRTKVVFDYRGPDLVKKWDLKMPEYSPKSTQIIASNDFQQVYYRQVLNFKGGKVIYNKITPDGALKTVELNSEDLDKGATKSMFCTDNYFFTLTVNEEKKNDVYRLHRFDHKTFTHKEILLDLPVDDKHVEYVYASFSGDNFYLVAKSSSPDVYSTYIVELDENGKLLNKLEITPDFGGEEVFGQDKSINFGGWHIISNNKYTENAFVDIVDNASYSGDIQNSKISSNFRQGIIYSTKGDIVVDKASNAIYFYGYTFKKNMFVYKYDLKGNFIWKFTQPMKVVAGKIYFTINMDNTVEFHEYKDKWILDSKGKLINQKDYNFTNANISFILQNEADKNPELKTFLESEDAQKQEEIKMWDTKEELILIGKKYSSSGLSTSKLNIFRFKK